ncbi:MAG: hypothetical protein JWM02_1588 [Frankiales bacterium]|nr:hypothetical protein [Frankiales bacterium]
MRALVPLCLLLAACASGSPPTTAQTYGGRCTSRQGLPDPVCTPGEADPRVTPANVLTTICTRGYTASVRPPKDVSHQLKIRLTGAYGIGDMPFADVELDHLIPLSLGGASTDANLWPQLRHGSHNVEDKDAVAERLNRRVCRGELGLRAAQHAMATDWRTAG